MRGKDKLIRAMIEDMIKVLEDNGYEYRYVPVTINADTLTRQGYPLEQSYKYGKDEYLSGSSEQGILERYKNKEVSDKNIYTITPCFRVEDEYNKNRLKEFLKIEMYSFNRTYQDSFDNYIKMLKIPYSVLQKYNKTGTIKFKNVSEDPGYHLSKTDTVLIAGGEELELGSCTLWGTEQSLRFNITGAKYTVSQTGLALPRALRVATLD